MILSGRFSRIHSRVLPWILALVLLNTGAVTAETASDKGAVNPGPLVVTKLIVNDLDAMADYYHKVYDFEPAQRVNANIAGRQVEEILFTQQNFILLAYPDQTAPVTGEVLLVVMTDDMDALLGKIKKFGGHIVEEPHKPEGYSFSVMFATDPEGHLIEHVQMSGGN